MALSKLTIDQNLKKLSDCGDTFNYTRGYSVFLQPLTTFDLYIKNKDSYKYLDTFGYNDDIPYLEIRFISDNEKYSLYNIEGTSQCDYFTISKKDNSYLRVIELIIFGYMIISTNDKQETYI